VILSRNAGKIQRLDLDFKGWLDDLDGSSLEASYASAQGIVATNYFVPAAVEDERVEATAKTDSVQDVMICFPGIELFQEPDPLLRE